MSPSEKQHDVDDISINLQKDNQQYILDIETYVIGVVAGEMPALFEEEALKAQAVASRTYAMNQLKNNNTINATIADQVYINENEMKLKWQSDFNKYYQKIKEAVNSTAGQIMYYNDQPIKAYYYSMSNGYTESSINVFNEQNDYLNIIPSPWDENNSKTINMSREDFCTKLSLNCREINISNIIKDQSNRVSKLTINNQEFTGIEIRKLLSLRSTDFTIDVSDDISITTKGYGHGVGMSQYGANNMAKAGYTYDQILKYYYQNIEINAI